MVMSLFEHVYEHHRTACDNTPYLVVYIFEAFFYLVQGDQAETRKDQRLKKLLWMYYQQSPEHQAGT